MYSITNIINIWLDIVNGIPFKYQSWSTSTNIITNGDLISVKYTPITQTTFLNTGVVF